MTILLLVKLTNMKFTIPLAIFSAKQKTINQVCIDIPQTNWEVFIFNFTKYKNNGYLSNDEKKYSEVLHTKHWENEDHT